MAEVHVQNSNTRIANGMLRTGKDGGRGNEVDQLRMTNWEVRLIHLSVKTL